MYKFTLFYPYIFLIVAVKAHLAYENETGLAWHKCIIPLSQTLQNSISRQTRQNTSYMTS